MSLGQKVVAWIKRHASTAKCCGRVGSPGLLTRLALEKLVNQGVRRAEREALLRVAKLLDKEELVVAARLVRQEAKKIRIRA